MGPPQLPELDLGPTVSKSPVRSPHKTAPSKVRGSSSPVKKLLVLRDVAQERAWAAQPAQLVIDVKPTQQALPPSPVRRYIELQAASAYSHAERRAEAMYRDAMAASLDLHPSSLPARRRIEPSASVEQITPSPRRSKKKKGRRTEAAAAMSEGRFADASAHLRESPLLTPSRLLRRIHPAPEYSVTSVRQVNAAESEAFSVWSTRRSLSWLRSAGRTGPTSRSTRPRRRLTPRASHRNGYRHRVA